MDEESLMMTPDEEVAMIFSSNKDDNGPTTSKRARLISCTQASSSRDDDHCQYGPSESRSIIHRKQIWDDSSDSDDSSNSVEMDTQVYANVEAYLSSIPQFDVGEHCRIPFYMELLGDNAKEIRTDLPKSDQYSDEAMEIVKKNFILSQLDYLIRENVRRTTKETRKESKRLSIIKPLPTMPRKDQGSKSE